MTVLLSITCDQHGVDEVSQKLASLRYSPGHYRGCCGREHKLQSKVERSSLLRSITEKNQ